MSRPPYTAQGSNTLRGGVASYGPKTLISNWEEDRTGGTFDGVRPEASSERQVRDLEATRGSLPAFGGFLLSSRRGIGATGSAGADGSVDMDEQARSAMTGTAVLTEVAVVGRRPTVEMPGGPATRKTALLRSPEPPTHFDAIEDRFDRGNLINPDRLYPASTWCTTQGREIFGATEGAHLDRYAMANKPRHLGKAGGLGDDPAAMAAYRERWCAEGSGSGRDARFESEQSRALGSAVQPLHRTAPARVLPGTTKGVETLRDRAQDAYGSEAVVTLARLLPLRLTLHTMRSILQGAGIRLSVDEGKNLWREIDAASKGDEDATCSRDHIVAVLSPASGAAMPQSRADALTACWLLLTALCAGSAGGKWRGVSLALLDARHDTSLHCDVKARKASVGEARKRFLDGIAYVVAGEPAAAPTTAAATSGASATTRVASGEAAASGGNDKEAISKWDAAYLPPAMAALRVSQAAFMRYYSLVSCAVDNDAAFIEHLMTVWHLHEASNLVPQERLPLSMRPRMLEAIAAHRGQAPLSDALRTAAGLSSAAVASAAAAAAAAAHVAAAFAGQAPAAPAGGAARSRGVRDVLQCGVAHMLVIVTHADGRRSLQKVACDRFMAGAGADAGADDAAVTEDLLARLAAAGITDAVDARADF